MLGTAQLAQPYGVLAKTDYPSRGREMDLLRLAESCGFSAIDTSPVYGNAEELIGASQTQLEVHTKCHPNLSVEDSLRQSKESLGRENLDIVYLHESLEPNSEAVRKVRRLAQHVGDDVGAIGASIYEVDEFLTALDMPDISVIQIPMNILDRRFANPELLNRAFELGKRIFVRSVFLQGLLVTDAADLPPSLSPLIPYLDHINQVSQQSGVSRIRLALSYVLQFRGISGIIVGASLPYELETVALEFSRANPREVLDLLGEVEAAPWDLVDPRKWSK